jgi:peptide-methionine (S)-S-oxide reductase
MMAIAAGVMLVAAFCWMLGATADETPNVGKLPPPTMPLKADKETKPGQTRTAVLAGGCFWCTEGVYRQFRGVTNATSGYSGDSKETANYEAVCSHTTNHAECVKITYDPSVITYGQLLQIFFSAHDPTTLDRQGNDVGHNYRSAIFYQSEDEKQVDEAYIKQLNDAKIFGDKIVTSLEPLKAFYPAEDYHQDYVKSHPNQPYVQACSLPKMQKVRELYKEWLK